MFVHVQKFEVEFGIFRGHCERQRLSGLKRTLTGNGSIIEKWEIRLNIRGLIESPDNLARHSASSPTLVSPQIFSARHM
jgi:hypothetical protein